MFELIAFTFSDPTALVIFLMCAVVGVQIARPILRGVQAGRELRTLRRFSR